MVAIMAAALFAGVGSLLGGTTGWAAAGGISLFWVAVLSECLRYKPAIEVDANEQQVREIPRRQMCWQTARQSWSPTFRLAWGWHGLFAGLLASLLTFWAADQPDPRETRKAYLVCGGLAAVVIIATRLGLLNRPRRSQPKNGGS
jgi:hypothetical protein